MAMRISCTRAIAPTQRTWFRTRKLSQIVAASAAPVSEDDKSKSGSYRWKKEAGAGNQKERVFKTSVVEVSKEKAQSGFGAKPGFGSGAAPAGGKGKGKKGAKGKGSRTSAKSRSTDFDVIRQADKEYDALITTQAKLNLPFLEYVVSVRAKTSPDKRHEKGMLSDWLPVCQLMVVLNEDDDEGEGNATYAQSPHMTSIVSCAIAQRKASVAAMARTLAKNDAKTLLEFAYEPEPSFRVAMEAIGGIESSEADAAFELLGLASGATPAEIRGAYRKLAAKYHPDKFSNASAEDAAEGVAKFQKIKDAHESLQGNRTQKGQTFKDLGGNDRTGFTEITFEEATCSVSDMDLAQNRAGLISLDQSLAVTPFAVRNLRYAKRLASEAEGHN